MISSQLDQAILPYDEVLRPADADFATAGLREASVVRATRLAVVNGSVLVGAIGEIAPARLRGIQTRVGDWVRGA
jgi:mRNA interferase MazF